MPSQTPPTTLHDYQVLGLKPGCSAAELRATYKSLVKRWHPDRYLDQQAEKSAAEEKLKVINAAYSRLCKDHPRPGTTASTAAKAAPMGRSSSQRDSSRHRRANPDNVTAPSQHPWIGLIAAVGRSLVNAYTLRSIQSRWIWIGTTLFALILLLLWWVDLPHFTQLHRELRFHVQGRDEPALHRPHPKKPAAAANSDMTALEPRVPGLGRSSIRPPRNGPRRPAVLLPSESVHFTLGSTANEVMRIQGKPQRINGQTWIYGMADVTFKDGRISGYNNFDASLRIKVLPTTPAPANQNHETFDIGAHRDEVLFAQGTPSRVDGNKWYYGLSEVVFKDGKVVAFSNFFNNLNVLMKPKDGAQPGTPSKEFTIGSTQDEVLAAQGTPSSVQANLWSYELSDVWFQNGKVRMVNDFSSVLKFRPLN
jgi:curved DNA-binding protein CbpA